MVGTITPIVNGERQKGQPPIALWLYVIASIFGAAVLGAFVAALGLLIPWHLWPFESEALVLVVIASIALLYSTHELRLLRLPVLQFHRQVPAHWRLVYPPRVTASLYGFCLGLGFATRIAVSTFYVITIWAFLSGAPLLSAGVIAAFGLGRAVPVFWVAHQQGDLLRQSRCVLAWEEWDLVIHLANGLTLALAGGWLLTAYLLR